MKIMRFVKCNLPVIFLQEGKKIIAYTPALDLSTCGKDVSQARKRFEEAVSIFFEETKNIEKVLLECGWKKVPSPQNWQPPIYIGAMQEQVNIPVYA